MLLMDPRAGAGGAAGSCCWGGCDVECYPTESTQNNFIAVRKMDSTGTLYVEVSCENLCSVSVALAMLFIKSQTNRPNSTHGPLRP